MTTLPNSSYLDATSYRYTTATTAYGLMAENPAPNTVQIVLGIQIGRNADCRGHKLYAVHHRVWTGLVGPPGASRRCNPPP